MEKKLRLSPYLFVSMLIGGGLNSPPVQSQEVKLGDLVILQPWSRAAPRGAEVALSYLTIENNDTAADRLVGGSTEAAEKLEIHQIIIAGAARPAHPANHQLPISPARNLTFHP